MDERQAILSEPSTAKVRPSRSSVHHSHASALACIVSPPVAHSASAGSGIAMLQQELRRAVEQRQLTLFYQPQFHVASGLACGVEVLARWFCSGGGSVEPCVFIPMAEEMNLIGALGAWVLEESCRCVSTWRAKDTDSIPLCVNVSPLQINPEFPGLVRHALETTRFPAKRLELEITEGHLIGDGDMILECFRELKRMGVRIAIDDFGSGYSSLSYLARLPVDRVKLDKSLVHNLTTHWRDVAILRAIIRLGVELGVAVIAEGVETEQQFQVLKNVGCTQVQGYLLARPKTQREAQIVAAQRWGRRAMSPVESGYMRRESLHAS